MKKTIIMLGIILALPLVFAMYGGETESIDFGFETNNCTIVPNETEGINFTFEGNNVLVTPAINFVGSFNITCYDWITEEEETEVYSGGGWYTYPWRKANETSNKTLIFGDEGFDDSNYTSEFEPEVIAEESKFKTSLIIGGVILLIIIIVAITLYILNKE